MPADWYCEVNGQQRGPITSGQLKQLATDGILQPGHPVWREGMQKKVPARTVKGLFDSAPDAAADTARQLAALTEPPPKSAIPELETLAEEPNKGEVLIEFETIEETVQEFETIDEPVGELETLEEASEEEDKPKKKRPKEEKEKEEEEEAPPEIVAEAAIIYREGHPDLEGPIEGMLTVETTGLRFQFEDEDEFRISFKKLESILEPAKGDFSPKVKKKAMAAKLGGKAGKLAAGLAGRWLGGTAGKVVDGVGSEAAKMAEKNGDLGKPPRNRLTVFARIRKERCKIYFDINGDGRDEMNEEAKVIYKQIQKARNKFTAAAEGPTINITLNSSGGGGEEGSPKKEKRESAAGPTSDKPFRVMMGDDIRGPYSLEELRGLLKAGKLGGALIGVETWLPVATLGSLLSASGGAGSRGGSSAAAKAGGSGGGGGEGGDEDVEDLEEQDEEFGDFEEVEDEDEEDEEEEETSSSSDDGDSLPVDDEFQIG